MAKRQSSKTRKTTETKIKLTLNLDGTGEAKISSGIGFFDHMLTLFSKHSLFDLELKAEGDLEVDAHHTVEDIGILLGDAFRDSLGDKRGICRYGFCSLPMDESRVEATLDLSGRPYLLYDITIENDTVGTFDTCLGNEFFQAFVNQSAINLHLVKKCGKNPHHLLEAAFKAVARALRQAVSFDLRENKIPSSKGVL